MGRFTLALGYVVTGDRRYLHAYNASFGPQPARPFQPPPSKEWLAFVKSHTKVSDLQPSDNPSKDNGHSKAQT